MPQTLCVILAKGKAPIDHKLQSFVLMQEEKKSLSQNSITIQQLQFQCIIMRGGYSSAPQQPGLSIRFDLSAVLHVLMSSSFIIWGG